MKGAKPCPTSSRKGGRFSTLFSRPVPKRSKPREISTYCFFKLSALLIQRVGESYDKLSMCSSAMEHAKLEWYRTRLAPYEDIKIEENGAI
jgi:hypothetical protein